MAALAATMLLISRTCPFLIRRGRVVWNVFVMPVTCRLSGRLVRRCPVWACISVRGVSGILTVPVSGSVTSLGMPQLCPPLEVGIGMTRLHLTVVYGIGRGSSLLHRMASLLLKVSRIRWPFTLIVCYGPFRHPAPRTLCCI